VDPRDVDHPDQAGQRAASVAATCAVVRSFASSGVDVAVDDVLPPDDASTEWLPRLSGLPMRLVVLLPSLDTCLARGGGRGKDVPAHLIRAHHEASRRWDPARCIDTDGQALDESLTALLERLEQPAARWPG
jgi:chloramphenicol 3-O-phosphotransferase